MIGLIMSHALILQHSPNFSAGRIVTVFRDFGIPLEIRRLWQGDDVPADLDDVRVLVSLGGNESLTDANTFAEHPYLAKEVSILQQLVQVHR